MTPEDASHLRVAVYDVEEPRGIVQGHGIHPGTVNRHGMMVQADQRVLVGMRRQAVGEIIQLLIA